MTLSIELPEAQETVLAAKAHAHGISLEEYVRQLLAHDLVPDWLQKSWDSVKAAGLDQLSMEEIDAEIATARKARRDARLQPGS
jgi:hypothetical protein